MVKVLEKRRNFWKFFSFSNMGNVSFVLPTRSCVVHQEEATFTAHLY
jgi:hypothetical protein